jgi:hypothetical protein
MDEIINYTSQKGACLRKGEDTMVKIWENWIEWLVYFS